MSPDHPNAEVIRTFYSCFANRDPDGMVACYAHDVEFSDPVFVDLAGGKARAMWKMLAAADSGLDLTASGIEADDQRGRAHWEARYTFTQTGRPVHNIIDAEFRFRGGRISEHHDQFDLWRWSRMALGPIALILGWSPSFQATIRGRASRRLEAFIAEHPEAAV